MLKGILAISGKPGLFKLITNAKNSIIVESLLDGKRMPAYATSKISSLEDISIFTLDGDVKLAEVFASIFEKDLDINPKKASSKQLKEAFSEALPDYDEDRVYVSDIKKVFAWYNVLKDKAIITSESIEEMRKEEESEEGDSEE
ncbi:DUF5606 family protein [Marinilabilia rubra]|uniref:Uncharacterized protein n=1 Tax=Marinilabilia rubra TaxID=2162893 RepID=A0A2U2B3T4_9BACT|nr:DUF5606 domain-containing protein [Marinilabilia rubra]PWD97697.1 hypothetical protein DDZ16_19275 [Marinilabilia rubra]